MIVLLQLAAALNAAPVQGAPQGTPEATPLVAATAPAVVPAGSAPLLRVGPVDLPVGVTRLVVTDTVPKAKKKSVELSEGYETRLKIHQFASYATIPLFAAQLIVGQNLYNADEKGGARPTWAVNAHKPLAYSLGALFAVNTVTGTMNWWETRHQAEGRTWRTIHAALMLASDAGFAYVGSLGECARTPGARQCSAGDRNKHRNFAIGSSVLALSSYAMMLSPFRKD